MDNKHTDLLVEPFPEISKSKEPFYWEDFEIECYHKYNNPQALKDLFDFIG